jgi:SAM-dependent methyltransferase
MRLRSIAGWFPKNRNMTRTANITTEEMFTKDYSERKPEFYSRLLVEIIRQGKPGTILDLGAGIGLLTELGHKWSLEVIGVEGSSYAVNAARSRVQGINMIVHDLGERLPFEDQSVSNIILNQVVEHLDPDRLDNVIKECYRILEIDGRIFIYSPSKRNIKEKSDPAHINLMLPSTLRNRMETVGFGILSQPDEGLWFLPFHHPLIYLFSRIIFKLFPNDWISSSANAIAIK